jgi:hypothetical protein
MGTQAAIVKPRCGLENQQTHSDSENGIEPMRFFRYPRAGRRDIFCK